MNEIFSKEKTKLFKNGGKKGPSQLATNRPLRRLSRTKFNSGNQSFSLEIQILANHVTLEKQFSKFLPDNFRIMRQSRQQLMLDSCRLIFERSHFERSENEFFRSRFSDLLELNSCAKLQN